MEASRWVCGDRQGTLNPRPEAASHLNTIETKILVEKLNRAKIDTPSLGFLNWPLVDLIYTLEIPSVDAEQVWRQLRSISIDTGYWPVIVSSLEDLEGIVDNISCHLEFDSASKTWSPRKKAFNNSELIIEEDDHKINLIRDLKKLEGNSEPLDPDGKGVVKPTPDDLIIAGEKLNLEQWLILKRALDEEYGEDVFVGEWPSEVEPDDNLQALLTWDPELGLRQLGAVFILLVRADYSWEVPAKLLYGGWNDCPVPQVHVAFLKRWFKMHDAELISLGLATFELIVSKPPTTREQSLKMAREHFDYCSDIIDQGAGSLSALAAELQNSRVWHFWWD